MKTLRILIAFAAASTFIVGLSASQVEEMAARITRMEAEMVTKNERIAVLEAAMKIAMDIFTDALETRDTSTSTTTTTTSTETKSGPGVIVTGGRPEVLVGVSVEVFNPHTNHSCSLPDMMMRDSHSQCGGIICGGGWSSTRRSCLKLNPLTGAFTPTSVSMVERRYSHLCWDVEGEGGPTLLIGGWYSPRSTELVSSDGLTSSASFTLQYDTIQACGIKTANKYVITGGYQFSSPDSALKNVTSYSRTGDAETLPQLNVARYNHACGSYETDEGDNVLLVTGGANDNDGKLDSTEILEEIWGTWRMTAPLPSARWGLRAAVLDNKILVFGGYNGSGSYLKDILQYNTASHTWEEVGQMKEARGNHAVAVLDDVSQLCP